MDPRRLAYLKAMDVDVWERRGLEPVREPPPIAPVDSGRAERSKAPRETASAAVGADQLHAATPRDGRQRVGSPDVEVASLDWESLEASVRQCTRCALHATRTQAVFGVGNRQAEWMIIGEAPGADEDRQGEPFVGKAGQLLNSMLKALGLARQEVFIANILKSRPPNNRDPRPDEVRACIPYLFRQIELIDPKLILCVGRIAAQTLLQTDTPIGKLRGRLHRIAADLPMIVTYHPAYLLRSPGEKRKAWSDLLLAQRTLSALRSGERV